MSVPAAPTSGLGGLLAATEPDVFDVCGPLPSGTTVLEASAGTGKTFTIAALATRYVAEGVARLAELMLVTFGRAATSELRDRVRERLVRTERELRTADPASSRDFLVRHLAAGIDPTELRTREQRLAQALADFDAATIATTHGFCLQMLSALGVAGDLDPDSTFVPDIRDLVNEVIDDEYLRRYAGVRPGGGLILAVDDAQRVARAAVEDPQARLEPAAAAPDTLAGHRYAFAKAVAEEVRRRKRARRLVDYDDLLVLLRDALHDPVHGSAAAQRIRSRYAVVLVDEFQDTDPVQWDILRTAFHGHRTLVLIGDPKQAIYAFRGGDVVTYVEAAKDARTTATLSTCWRSDAALLTALDHVFAGAALGDPAIVVHRVEAAHEHAGRRLDAGLPAGGAGATAPIPRAPLRVRQVLRSAFGLKGTKSPAVGEVRSLVVADVAADVVAQLDGTRILDAGAWRPLRPGDIAVLTRRNADAAAVQEALHKVGVPAVFPGLTSVFGTTSAQDWLKLLLALEQPGHSGRTATLALTQWIGWDAARLARAGDAAREELADRTRTWAQVLAERGVAAVFEAASADGLAERLMAWSDGERRLTDLRHIGQSLHVAAVRQGLGTAALTDWLRRRIKDATGDQSEERSRRLESDAEAVQVITVHASKGLEFAVVYVPFGWDRWEGENPPLLTYHAQQDAAGTGGDGAGARGPRTLHVGGTGAPGYSQARDLYLGEDRGEDLRLLYVAMTRARCQVVAHWAPTGRNSARGALGRLLLGGSPPGAEPPAQVSLPTDDKITAAFRAIAARSAATMGVEPVVGPPSPGPDGTPRSWVPPRPAQPALDAARFGRRLDTAWRRTSYTGLTAAAHAEQGAASEPETTGIQDEGETVTVPQDPPDHPAAAVASPMAAMPAGAGFGTLVHTVLEAADPGAADLTGELERRGRQAGAGRAPGVDVGELAAALALVLTTPLSSPSGAAGLSRVPPGLRLCDVAAGDRLAELEFELPLGGGDRLGVPVSGIGAGGPPGSGAPSGGRDGAGPGAASVGDIAALLRRHLDPADPLAPYPARLAGAELDTGRLRGYLTGSLDAVLRLRPAAAREAGARATGANAGEPVYVVVDYKTNRLGPVGEPLTAWLYRGQALAEAMMQAHYPLQLMLYLVALHRFLRWRQPGYDPEVHLGGGLYLFLRGMCGPDTPVVDGGVCGVMGWRPPTALVTDLSALLDGTLRRSAHAGIPATATEQGRLW